MQNQAAENLERLKDNRYPGRGICIGLDESGTVLLQVYWIMGRSANSRNRIFVASGGELRTGPADESKVEDPTLIIYNAMRELPGAFIVTNGDQTDTVYDGLKAGETFVEALERREYEPDAPNYTPRISAVTFIRGSSIITYMSILKHSSATGAAQRHTFQYDALPAGAGYTVTTYLGDGSPLPSFEGEPWLLPLSGSPREAGETVWNALNGENRISLAVKAVDMATGKSGIEVFNAYEKVK